MMKSATAVKAKIKNKAGGDSDKSQIMLRIYLMERLLERVSLSQNRDNFVLKGGLLVSSLVGVDMRSTMDVDTTVKSIPLNKRSAQKILEEIIAIEVDDGVIFRMTIEDRTINLLAYNLETLLAEKLETIMVRAEANTRMRDFYDIHVLLEQDAVTIDRDTMKSAFYATCKRRESTEQL